MISWFARVEREGWHPTLKVYTRCLTWIWVGFFLTMAAVSLVACRHRPTHGVGVVHCSGQLSLCRHAVRG